MTLENATLVIHIKVKYGQLHIVLVEYIDLVLDTRLGLH